MTYRKLSFIIIFTTVLGAKMPASTKQEGTISKILILNSNFKVIKTLNSNSDIEAFSQYWFSKQEHASSEKAPGHYKIDIYTTNSNNRYLYNENGTVRLLTKTMTPEYQIHNFKSFNKLLGIVE